MKNYLLVLVILLSIPVLSQAQKDARKASGLKSMTEVPKMTLPALNNKTLYEEELNRRAPGIAPKFAETIEVEVSTTTHGLWEVADDGILVWRYRVHSAEAKSLNFGFSKFVMPKGGSLILYATDSDKVMGPFTPADNDEHEELWTPIVEGDDVIIEVQVPAEVQSELQLELKSVNHDYVGFAQMSVLSGSCNLDVICGAADGWGIVDGYRDIIRSVAVISTGGGTFCTGFLVNNVNNDCTPFFITANHCGIGSGNAASLVTYWNFENSTCREPGSSESGGNGDGQLNDFNTGSIHRASYSPSDVTLVELDDPVSPTADAIFAGWSAEYVMPQDTIIAIHHPSTDEKRISFEFDPALPGLDLANNVVDIAQADHVIVPDWDIGTTEGGSSGSPLFNNQKQVVGQLHGGGAACGNNSYDTYGWFNTSWYGGGSSNNSLRFWLDPNDTGILNIGGKSCGFVVDVSPAFQEFCAPADALFNLQVAENFTSDVTLSANNVPTGAMVTFNPNPVAPNGTSVMTLTNTGAITSGQYTIEIAGTDGIESTTSVVTVNVLAGTPIALGQLSPENGLVGSTTTPEFNWNESADGGAYEIQIATDAGFANVVESANSLGGATYTSGFLNTMTTYYWRVRASNICGDGPWSATWNFTTADVSCGVLSSADIPVEISAGPANTVSSTLMITSTGLITDLNLINLEILHTYVGDLSGTLESPSGTVVQLFNEPDNGGCGENNLSVSFDDDATNTAQDFVGTCDPGGTAISGAFQSADLMATFNGEEAMGQWILTIVDDAGSDGGTIEGWDLEICTTVPVDLSFSPSTSELMGCLNENYSLELTLGTAFEATGATLSATGNPAGSTVTFSNNPILPGETAGVNITGVNVGGVYPMTFTANDGVNSTDVMVTLTVQSAPSAAALIFPANNETGVVLSPTLDWDAATDVNSYYIEIASDAAFTNIVNDGNTTLLTYPIPLALEFGTAYFWRVTAEGNCGNTISTVNSFTTVLDLVVTVSPESQMVCNTDELVFEIAVGASFVPPVMINHVTPLVVTVDYDVDPNNVTPGSTVTATVTDLSGVGEGTYDFNFEITGANNSMSALSNIVVDAPPVQSDLLMPANETVNQLVVPTLGWTTTANTSTYRVDIALDQAFTNLVETETTTGTSYTVTAPLNFLTTYYWKVVTENDCGKTTSEVYSFTTEMEVAVDELEGNAFSILPNPTNGLVNVVFAQALNKDLTVEVYAINGQLLQQKRYDGFVEQLPIELSSYAAGVYVIRLVTAKAAVARRITLQK